MSHSYIFWNRGESICAPVHTYQTSGGVFWVILKLTIPYPLNHNRHIKSGVIHNYIFLPPMHENKKDHMHWANMSTYCTYNLTHTPHTPTVKVLECDTIIQKYFSTIIRRFNNKIVYVQWTVQPLRRKRGYLRLLPIQSIHWDKDVNRLLNHFCTSCCSFSFHKWNSSP